MAFVHVPFWSQNALTTLIIGLYSLIVSLTLETHHNAMMLPPHAPLVLPMHED
jgi:hypothetical protein